MFSRERRPFPGFQNRGEVRASAFALPFETVAWTGSHRSRPVHSHPARIVSSRSSAPPGRPMEALSSRTPRGNSARADSAAISKPALARAGRTGARKEEDEENQQAAREEPQPPPPGESPTPQVLSLRIGGVPERPPAAGAREHRGPFRARPIRGWSRPCTPFRRTVPHSPWQGGHVQVSVSRDRVLAGPEDDDLSAQETECGSGVVPVRERYGELGRNGA